MLNTKLPLIFLFASSVIYAIFMSLMTFTKSKISMFPDRYVQQINKDDKGNYHTTLLATTVGSYIGALAIGLFLLERVISKDNYGQVTGFKYTTLFMYLFGLAVLISLAILLAYFSYNERVFGIGSSENLTYNYPFTATLSYFFVFLILGAIYVSDVFKLEQQRKQEISS